MGIVFLGGDSPEDNPIQPDKGMIDPTAVAKRPIRRRSYLESDFRLAIFERCEGASAVPHDDGRPADPYNRTVVSQIARGAKNDGINLYGRAYNPPVDQERLEHERYDADFALCLYPDVNAIGPELGMIVMRSKRRYHHIFVVTQKYAPDANERISGITSIVPNSFTGNRLVAQPFPETRIDADTEEYEQETFDAVEGRVMSIWNAMSLRDPERREMLLSYFSQPGSATLPVGKSES